MVSSCRDYARQDTISVSTELLHNINITNNRRRLSPFEGRPIGSRPGHGSRMRVRLWANGGRRGGSSRAGRAHPPSQIVLQSAERAPRAAFTWTVSGMRPVTGTPRNGPRVSATDRPFAVKWRPRTC